MYYAFDVFVWNIANIAINTYVSLWLYVTAGIRDKREFYMY